MTLVAFDFLADGAVLALVEELFDALLHLESGIVFGLPFKEVVGGSNGVVLV
jgi:hypothetical protein